MGAVFNLGISAVGRRGGCVHVAAALMLAVGVANGRAHAEINFGPPHVTAAEGEPIIESVGDLDGNDTVDVVAVIPNPNPLLDGLIQVFLNNGVDGGGGWLGLQAQAPITVGRNPSAVAVGLFNADPHLDLAVANAGDNNVWILINNGDATFFVAGVVTVGPQPSAIVAASFNTDCDPNSDDFTDLAVTNRAGNSVTILFGNGVGGFSTDNPCGGGSAAAPPIPVPQEPVAILADDFDNDEDPSDLGGASKAGLGAGRQTGSAWVLRSNGDGTFAPLQVIDVGVDPKDLSADDFNGDGVSEIAVVNAGVGLLGGSVSMLVNDGSGNFTPLPEIPVGPAARSVDSGDLDGDADPDLAVIADDEAIGGALLVLENVAGGPGEIELGVPVAFGVGVGADPNDVVVANINEDVSLDVVTVNADTGSTGGSVSVLLSVPIPPPCPGDCQIDPDGVVGIPDFLAMLAQWGNPGPCDLDGDGVVGIGDFLQLLADWGTCP
jgi:hypothetical protein